jgi:drug/metabolite transporter (DMT)-like permease
MSLPIALAVLFSAFCHASWNAILRMRADKIIAITLLVAAAGLIALPALFFVPVPLAAAWPFLIASAFVHIGYNSFLALAYHHGELTKVYPLVRGSAPLTTLVIALLFLHEAVTATEIVGIVVLTIGIMVLALDGGRRALLASPQVLLYAAATSLCITAYTLSDGLGARVAGSTNGYVLWLFAIDSLPLLIFVLVRRRRTFLAAVGPNWLAGLVGGALSLLAYWIVIWAFTKAPIPVVAALRETSILFALLIGMLWIGETVTKVRIASIVLVVAGLALMRL